MRSIKQSESNYFKCRFRVSLSCFRLITFTAIKELNRSSVFFSTAIKSSRVSICFIYFVSNIQSAAVLIIPLMKMLLQHSNFPTVEQMRDFLYSLISTTFVAWLFTVFVPDCPNLSRIFNNRRSKIDLVQRYNWRICCFLHVKSAVIASKGPEEQLKERQRYFGKTVTGTRRICELLFHVQRGGIIWISLDLGSLRECHNKTEDIT